MFSFFKRKKKPETPETAPEQNAQPVETAESAPAITAPEHTHTEPGHIPVTVAEFEQPQPLSEHAREAVAEDAAGHPVSQLVADVVGGSDKLPEQFDPEAPVGRIHVPQPAPEAAPAELSGHAAADALKQADSIATVAAAVPVAAAAAAAEQAAAEEPAKPGWAARLKQGLTKSRDQMAKSLAGVFGGGQIDEDLYEELETVLITSDMGIEATDYLMKDVRKRVSLKGLKDGNELRGALKDAIYELIKPLEQPLEIPARKEPFVIMLAGINGAGKTTSIGKLAKYFQSQGKSVLLAAGDTFRAAAREQLQEWGARNNVTVISQASGDSAAVCFDAVEAAKARGIDHEASRDLAYEIRSLAIDLFNTHDMLTQSQRLTGLLQELFAELPEVSERVEQDADALADIFHERKQAVARRDEWAREITYRAEIGVMFKDTLSISPDGISWKGQSFSLDSITRVRWGGVRHSVNGVPTGTTYTIAFGDKRSEAVVELKKEDIYSKFIDKLWRAVCVRLLGEMLEALKDGRDLYFGDALLHDDGITLVKHKFLGANERVRCTWGQVQIWNADGSFCIGSKDDKKTNVGISYIHVANTHILEQLIRMAFKKPGLRRLSELLQ